MTVPHSAATAAASSIAAVATAGAVQQAHRHVVGRVARRAADAVEDRGGAVVGTERAHDRLESRAPELAGAVLGLDQAVREEARDAARRERDSRLAPPGRQTDP